MHKISNTQGPLHRESIPLERMGHSAEELKFETNQALSAEVAPLPSKALLDLIGSIRNIDHLRLSAPMLTDSIRSKGQQLRILQRVVGRLKDDSFKDMASVLSDESLNLDDESAKVVRVAMDREIKMLELVQNLAQSRASVRVKVAALQEG